MVVSSDTKKGDSSRGVDFGTPVKRTHEKDGLLSGQILFERKETRVD